ncbi:hypothetical protein QUF58_06995 [Anaerolineales bacterium HSG24]|nr:hypothetical protein [Anaerolineales bacterium HSG24]
MKEKIINIIISIVAGFIFMELITVGWYFFNDSKLFYTNTKIYQLIEEAESNKLTGERIHPYFGFSNPVAEDSVNNHGFVSPYNYPFIRNNENQYIIGIFGGSVAKGFALEGKKQLIEALKKHTFFEDKEIILLNFCAGGYKQPQQLLILNYYLTVGQELDMVINVDGFNELALSNRNNEQAIDISMPSVDHIGPLTNLIDQTTLTREKLESLASINQHKIRLNRVVEMMNNTHFASAYFMLEQFYKILYSRYTTELVTFQQLESNSLDDSIVHIYLADKQSSLILFDHIVLHWTNASIMMNETLKSKHILYFHFLQPNQYYSNKVFSDEERKIAFVEDHPYRAPIEKGYPILMDQAGFLKQNGVNFYSAVNIFDDEVNIIYKDSCCHYNQLGNDVLANFISDSILDMNYFHASN